MSEFGPGNIVEKNGDIVVPDTPDELGWNRESSEPDHHLGKIEDKIIDAAQTLLGSIDGDVSANRPMDTKPEYGPGYNAIVSHIEAGIAKSRKGGYAAIKVQDKNGIEIPLGRYLATDLFEEQKAGTISKEELKAILDQYAPARKPVLPQKSVPLSSQESGGKYKDPRMAAANDDS